MPRDVEKEEGGEYDVSTKLMARLATGLVIFAESQLDIVTI